MTPELLSKAMGITLSRAQVWAPGFTQAMDAYDISTPTRQADFIAQCGHESRGLQFLTELWGPAQVPAQVTYERDFDKPWGPTLKKGDRNFKAWTLGNSERGDGYAYRGRGPIQITGRRWSQKMRDDLRAKLGVGANVPDFEASPGLMALPAWGPCGAANFWSANNLNRYADAQDFVGETLLINGGQNGLADRISRRNIARDALGLS